MGACDGFGSANWDALRTIAPPGAVGLEPLISSNSVAPVSVRLIGLRRVGSELSVDRIWLVAEAEAWGNLAQGCAGFARRSQNGIRGSPRLADPRRRMIRQTAEGTVTEE
jgi:hypothetical protein